MEEEMLNENENQLNQTYDQKLSVAEFLSTVIFNAEQFGLSYEKIFTEKNTIRAVTPSPPPHIAEPINIFPKDEPTDAEKGQPHQLKLYRDGSTLYRLLDGDDENEPYQKIPKSYFDFLRQDIRGYYYGDDDEGDFKDLKKNISQSYKKFQQMNKMMTEVI